MFHRLLLLLLVMMLMCMQWCVSSLLLLRGRLLIHANIERSGMGGHSADVIEEHGEFFAKLIDVRSFQKLDDFEHDRHTSGVEGISGGMSGILVTDRVAKYDDV